MQGAQCVGGSRQGSALPRSPASSWWAAPKAAAKPRESGSVEGETVRISGGITGIEAENIQKIFDSFTEDTGIIVEYTGDKGFEGNIVTKVAGGDAPDIAIVPQPGLLKALVDTGEVKPAPEAVEANVDANWSPDWKVYGTIDDVFYAAPMLAERQGLRLVFARVVRRSGASRCRPRGMSCSRSPRPSGTRPASRRGAPASSPRRASGWPGTDWIEGLVLRQSGPEVYDQWVANEVKFTDPEIEDAFNAVGEILQNPDYVNAGFGDVASINSTAFANVAAPVANGTCALTHQADFLAANFLDVETADGATPDGGARRRRLRLRPPGFRAGGRLPAVEVGGEFVAGFSDDAATAGCARVHVDSGMGGRARRAGWQDLGQPERRPVPRLEPVPHRCDGARCRTPAPSCASTRPT